MARLCLRAFVVWWQIVLDRVCSVLPLEFRGGDPVSGQTFSYMITWPY